MYPKQRVLLSLCEEPAKRHRQSCILFTSSVVGFITQKMQRSGRHVYVPPARVQMNLSAFACGEETLQRHGHINNGHGLQPNLSGAREVGIEQSFPA